MSGSANDLSSGSSAAAGAFLADLERWLALDVSPAPPELRTRLLAWLRAAQSASPSLALVHQLAARALEVADAGSAREDRAADLRVHIAQACAAERADLEAARAAVARTAERLIEGREPLIATLSNSGTVRDALMLSRGKGRRPHALIGEGRPLMEGRHLASALTKAGIPAWLVADAALPLLISQTHMVWLGAAAVTDRGVINKVGSYAAALAAREHSVPVYVLAERKKFIPASTGALKIVEMRPEEIWDRPDEGVRPRNVYFELVPLELLRGVAVEDGVVGVTEAALMARDRALPEELAAS